MLEVQMPGTCIRQLETPVPSEYYYGCVGIVVKEGIVQNPPHYMGQVPIYDDFKVFINQPYENLIEDAKTTHLGYKFQVLYQGQAVYSDKVDGEGYIEVGVDEAGNVLIVSPFGDSPKYENFIKFIIPCLYSRNIFFVFSQY
ncbi:hypothetical protein HELRODRAFT_188487 [Helobdella robusta]|uniref:Uncharacterized protein n=1 Tax=Helobdella robusta TaxID=6412 RepID=T1FQ16_HELRO|nr:hypothetical protein HELRODRAFT_188487 [Helobdella robusta]ESO01813.1 hypothetical protein HELRODRAFT_188487 [Helobdella robusta]